MLREVVTRGETCEGVVMGLTVNAPDKTRKKETKCSRKGC